MRKISLLGMGIVAGLAGCTAQTSVDQLSLRPETIRLCQGSQCAQAPASVSTFQSMPVDVAAQQRHFQLVQLAEQDARAAYDLGMRLLRGDGVERNGYDAVCAGTALSERLGGNGGRSRRSPSLAHARSGPG